jgi:hypothetical protein
VDNTRAHARPLLFFQAIHSQAAESMTPLKVVLTICRV